MKVISNPRSMIWFGADGNNGINLYCARTVPSHGIQPDIVSITIKAEDAPDFVPGLVAAIGRLAGVGPTTFNGGGVGAIIDMQASYFGDKHIIVRHDSDSANRTYIPNNFYFDGMTSAQQQLIQDLWDDLRYLLAAPVPTSIPLGIPGRQLTIGKCVYWPANVKKFEIREISAPGVSYQFWDGGNATTVSTPQMAYILNALLSYGDFTQVCGTDLFRDYVPAESYYLGLQYNGSAMSGIEIMHSVAPSAGQTAGVHQSMGILQNTSLAEFCYNAQAALSRALACLPILYVTNQELDGIEVDPVAIATAVMAQATPYADGKFESVHSHIDGVQTQLDGQVTGLHTDLHDQAVNLTGTINGQADGIHSHLTGVQNDISAVHSHIEGAQASLESGDMTRAGMQLTAALATFKKLTSAKVYNKLIDSLSRCAYESGTIHQPGENMTKASAGPMSVVFNLLDDSGRVQDSPASTEEE